jgi:hypothetical protein
MALDNIELQPTTLTIRVTAEDIAAGRESGAGYWVWVSKTRLNGYFEGKYVEIGLPVIANRLIKTFDAGHPTYPFSFPLELPFPAPQLGSEAI